MTNPIDNPWRESLQNCMTGDNYLRTTEWHQLIEELDRLYAIEEASALAPAREKSEPAPVAQEAVCATCGGTRVDPGGLPICRSCAAPTAAQGLSDAEIASKVAHERQLRLDRLDRAILSAKRAAQETKP